MQVKGHSLPPSPLEVSPHYCVTTTCPPPLNLICFVYTSSPPSKSSKRSPVHTLQRLINTCTANLQLHVHAGLDVARKRRLPSLVKWRACFSCGRNTMTFVQKIHFVIGYTLPPVLCDCRLCGCQEEPKPGKGD